MSMPKKSPNVIEWKSVLVELALRRPIEGPFGGPDDRTE